VPEALCRDPLWMRKRGRESEAARVPVPLMDTIVVAGKRAEPPPAVTVDRPVLSRRRFVENG
jgi:hypothetical protein